MKKQKTRGTRSPARSIDATSRSVSREEIIVPVVHETATVSKRVVDRGAVRVSKVVREVEEIVDTSTVDEEIELEHVARNQWLDKPATPRTEGDTVIIPVMEEVLVVEKRILLREEVYIRRKKVKKPQTEKVRLRREEISVDDQRRR